MNTTTELAKIFDKTDSLVRLRVEQNKIHPSCAAGCSHCCYSLVEIPVVEGIALARWLRGRTDELFSFRRRLKERIPHVRAVAMKPRSQQHSAHMAGAVPCLFLREGLCTAYGMRPIACRTFLVTSHPSECAAALSAKGWGDVKIVNALPVLASVYPEVVALSNRAELPAGPVPLPIAVAWGLEIIAKGVKVWLATNAARPAEDPIGFHFWEQAMSRPGDHPVP